MRLLVINGANLNFLGIREPEIYGKKSYKDLYDMIKEYASKNNIDIEIYQSNHEGDLVDKIQEAYYKNVDGIVINPGGYTHTSVAILDALKAVNIKFVEVHISKVDEREAFRQISYIREYAALTIIGHGLEGYIEALDYLKDLMKNEN